MWAGGVVHVLDDDLALGRAARVLRGPRHGELAARHVRNRRCLVVGRPTVAIASLGIVLRVHQAVVVVAVAAALLEAVVGAGRVLHVHIARDRVEEREQRKRAEGHQCQSGEHASLLTRLLADIP